MTIKNVKNGSEIKLVLTGRLDTTTSPNLEAEIKTLPDGVQKLVLDMTGLEYISSAGLRVLLSAQKLMSKKSGSMVIRGVNDTVMEVFAVTGFVDILDIE